MPLKINGTTVNSVLYDGTDLNTLKYNDTLVFEKDLESTPLTIRALEDNTEVLITYERTSGSYLPPTLKYRVEGNDWASYTYNTYIYLSKYQRVQFKGTSSTLSAQTAYVSLVTYRGNVAVSGNINSLINFSNILTDYCYYKLFYNCGRITKLNVVLPSTTLAAHCYDRMFDCCNITSTPALPATVLAEGCYYMMFAGCDKLVNIQELPATTLADYCYQYMFGNCTSLTIAPELQATTLASYCYDQMFFGCTSLITVPKLPAVALANNCYRYMFRGCTSLQINDTQSSYITNAWTMPEIGTFTNTYSQTGMFFNCAGTRSSEDMPGQAGQSYTYYTQNPPI